jgi:hypothetical protein
MGEPRDDFFRGSEIRIASTTRSRLAGGRSRMSFSAGSLIRSEGDAEENLGAALLPDVM